MKPDVAGYHCTIDTRTFATTVGGVLRDVRTGRSLSLRQVAIRSGGRFKPSSVASYERGERQLSLERLFSLSAVYGVEPERIVAAVAHRLEASGEMPRGPGGPDSGVVEILARASER